MGTCGYDQSFVVAIRCDIISNILNFFMSNFCTVIFNTPTILDFFAYERCQNALASHLFLITCADHTQLSSQR